jgi:hypothetical protein
VGKHDGPNESSLSSNRAVVRKPFS